MQRVPVEAPVLKKNDEAARDLRSLFERRGILTLNFMSAPGAGKTTVLEHTMRRMHGRFRPAVIEGDLQTDLDAQRIRATGVPAYQIVTNTCCHLDARMITRAIDELPIDAVDTLFIENVGNMVCPANFDLGEQLRVMVYSVPEGAEKPKKYPNMFHRSHAVLLNKIDLLPYVDIALDELIRNVNEVSPHAAVIPLSCRTGEGLDGWIDWLAARIGEHKRHAAAAVQEA